MNFYFEVELHTYIPHPALQQIVQSISTINLLLPEGIDSVVTPHPATPLQCLLFYCNNPISMNRDLEATFEKQPHSVLIGSQYSRVNIKVHSRLTAIRVDFLPGAVYRLLRIPMMELFDAGFDAQDYFGAEMRSLDEQLKNITSLYEGKTIVEEFLLRKIAGLADRTPFDAVLYELLYSNQYQTIENAASLSYLSLKQFERKCNERIGMNPKLFTRIIRFSKAYRLHESNPHLSWTQIAHESGYYDQMHMIKDFKTFAGVNPTVIEHQLLSTPLRMQKHLTF